MKHDLHTCTHPIKIYSDELLETNQRKWKCTTCTARGLESMVHMLQTYNEILHGNRQSTS